MCPLQIEDLEAWKNAAYNGDKLAPYNIGLMY